MATITVDWPIPYDHRPNDFEVVGRHIAQTILMERYIDLILLNQGGSPRTSSGPSSQRRLTASKT